MDFLHQFPQSVWARAIEERYGLDLPAALTQREEARKKKIKGFSKGYYETIQDAADVIYQGLTYKGNQPEEVTRIRESAYNNAKNFIDSELAQRPDGGGAWMNINYPRTEYNFSVRKRATSTTIKNNYIRELVDRLEGPKGSSAVGFDLSKIRNFDPENPVGNWYTIGFTCPQVKQISNNLQSWVTYASQGLLHAPNTIDPKTHRERSKTEYAANTEATEEEIERDIYRTPLYNKYAKYIKELEEKFIKKALTQKDVTILNKKFQLKKPNTDIYSYLLANRARFADDLKKEVNIRNPHKMTFNNLSHIVQHAEHSVKFEEKLIDALVDIDLITYPIQNYHGEDFDTMSFSKLRHPTVANPHHPGQTMPELLPGKILFNINQTIEKLQKKVADAEAKEDPEEVQRLGDLIRNLEATRRVGHHYDPRDIEQPAANRKRKPIFYQFDNERDVPEDLDKRDRTLAGGVYPNKSSEYEAGPGRQDLNQNLENLMLVMGDDDLFDELVKKFVKENYEGRFNIFLKTFYDPEEGIISPTTYLAFKNLIKDKALRNLRLFNLTRPIATRLAQTVISQTLRSLMSSLSYVLYKKNLGVSGTMRKRFGKDADAAAVRAAIGEMMDKAIT
jgi:hypothetical protein